MPGNDGAVIVGTDFSGLDSPLLALAKAGVRVRHAFSCDNSRASVAYIMHHHRPDIIYLDVTAREPEAAPRVDLYVAGFPCQPFSVAGRGAGRADTRGRLVDYALKYIGFHKPTVVVLENVVGFLRKRHRRAYKALTKHLKDLDYVIHDSNPVYNALHYGLPQNRPRVFLVCIQRLSVKSPYKRPPAIRPRVSVTKVLEERTTADQRLGRPGDGYSSTVKRNVAEAYERLAAKGVDAARTCVIIEAGAGPKRKAHFAVGVCPCLTATRSAGFGYWVSTRGRPLSLTEMARAQGFPDSSVGGLDKVGISRQQMAFMLGNSMAIDVLARILLEALRAAGLIKGVA